MMAGFRRRYGSSPLHLLGHLIAFAVAAWAIAQILGGGSIINWIAWFVGAAVLHDLVLLPLYSVVDRIVHHGSHQLPRPRRVPISNHLRAPALISGVLLLVYFPLILGLSSRNYFNDTGHHLGGYTRNWLLITAALFLVSALVYAIRVYRATPRRSRPSSGQPPPPGERAGA